MTQRELDELQRRANADPDDKRARIEHYVARGRVEGPQVFVENQEIWDSFSPELQDQAISAISSRLEPLFEWTATTIHECGGRRHRIASFKHVHTGIELNLIPGGEFQMGTHAQDLEELHSFCRTFYSGFDRDWLEWQIPRHRVTIKPFLAGRFPVLWSQWQQLDNECRFESEESELPAYRISWQETQQWLQKTKQELRLLSESEWEYACRGGVDKRFYWGDHIDESYIWYDKNSNDQAHNVFEHVDKANAFGLVDMLGNVWEWCQDEWIPDYTSGPHNEQPRRGGDPSQRVIRGGGWYVDGGYLHCSYRTSDGSDYSNFCRGLRVARSLDLE